MKNKQEYLISILLGILGLFVFLWSITIPLMVAVEKSSIVNSRFFPKLMGAVLVFLAIVMALETILKKGPRTTEESEVKERELRKGEKWAWWAGMGSIYIAYYFVFQPFGFLLSSTLFIMVFLIFLGTRKWYAIFFLSLIVPLSVYILFKTTLGVPLPDGLIFF